MSALQAALLVVGCLIVIGGPALWWVFYRMDSQPTSEHPQELAKRMPAGSIKIMEGVLGVTLPFDYASFLQERQQLPDNTSVIDAHDLIIELTEQYRQGAYGLPPWPKHFVYIGDEADACPYAIDCLSGEVMCLHKGNVAARPISRWSSFTEFRKEISGN